MCMFFCTKSHKKNQHINDGSLFVYVEELGYGMPFWNEQQKNKS